MKHTIGVKEIERGELAQTHVEMVVCVMHTSEGNVVEELLVDIFTRALP